MKKILATAAVLAVALGATAPIASSSYGTGRSVSTTHP